MCLLRSRCAIQYNKHGYEYGFTLVELLVVIALVGILAGIFTTIINPSALQRKAKDASLIAAVNKSVAAISAYDATYGSLPSDRAMLNLIQYSDFRFCCYDTMAVGYQISGIETPKTCSSSTEWRGEGTYGCFFVYYGEAANGYSSNAVDVEEYYIFIKSFVVPDSLLAYSSRKNYFYVCPVSLGHPREYSVHEKCSKYQ